MRTILLTGVHGYIMRSVLDKLVIPQDTRLIGVDNLTYGGRFEFKHSRFDWEWGDIRDKQFLTHLFDKYRPDYVLHGAALVGDGACKINEKATVDINEKATDTIAQLCQKWNSHLVFLSTCSVYGANNNLLNENSPTNPLSLYASTKLAAEEHVKKVSRHTIFRLGTVHGYLGGRFRNDLVANVLTIKAARGYILELSGQDQWRPMVYVGDIGDCLVRAVEKDITGTYILAHQNYTIKEIGEVVTSIIPAKVHVSGISFEDQRNYKVDNTKALKAGFECPTRLETSIKEMLKEIKEHRLANIWHDVWHNEKYLRGPDGQAAINSY